MSLLLGLLLGILLLPQEGEGHAPDRMVFKRALFEADVRRSLSLHLNCQSKEALQLHVLLVFGWQGERYHNALLFNPRHHAKYREITRDSDFHVSRELNIVSKDQLLRMQFDVAGHGTEERFVGGHKLEYEALLFMDFHSSIWNECNTILFEESRVTLLFQAGEVSPRERGEFHAFYDLECERGEHRHCEVSLRDYKINERESVGEAHRLIIDLDSPHNLLPPELFARWKYHDEKRLRVTGPDGRLILMLNSQFRYLLNEKSTDIVVGIDLVHHFQKVELSLHRGRVILWHSWCFEEKETFDALKAVIYYFIGLVLTCITYWLTSPNYDVLTPTEKNPPAMFDFPYRLVLVEIVSLLVALSIWILVFLAGGGTSGTSLDEWPIVLQRRLLVFLLALYHVLISLALFVKTPRMTWHSLRYYYYYATFMGSTRRDAEDYNKIKSLARMETEPVPMRMVLLRNMTCNTVNATTLLLILNYLSEEKALYNIVFMVTSLVLLFFYVRNLFVSLLFLCMSGVRKEALLTIVTALSAIVFFVYTVLTLDMTYTLFLTHLNSLFTHRVITNAVGTIICFTAVGALLSVFVPLVEAIQQANRKTPPESTLK
jgi:hypothetical protein